MKLLKTTIVIECGGDFLSAKTSLRLQELGAKVIRVTDSEIDDLLSDKAYFSQYYNDASLHSLVLNRGKDERKVKNIPEFEELLKAADVLIYNENDKFWHKYGQNKERLKTLFPHLIFAAHSAFGDHSSYQTTVGDDLLAQALSGITTLSGNRDDFPTAMGGMVGAVFCASHLTQAILLALYHRETQAKTCEVETSILESLLAIEFEAITTSVSNKYIQPARAIKGNAHAYLPAPYGVYESLDGYFAMSYVPAPIIAKMMGVELPKVFHDGSSWFSQKDDIMAFFAEIFITRTNQEWLDLFEPADIWCSAINSLSEIIEHEGYKELDMERTIKLSNGEEVVTTKCPYVIETDDENLQTNSSLLKNKWHKNQAKNPEKPLEGLLVVDFSQFLSGPSATLQLADFGATVIKVERLGAGDAGRKVVIADVVMDGESSGFLSISRNKYSMQADLKNADDKAMVIRLIEQADVMVQNFRPAAMKRLGLDFESVKHINPSIVYAEISGYGQSGCWVDKPGQDFIVQALSGACTMSGYTKDGMPIPMGLSVIDMLSGAHLVEGIMAALYHRQKNCCGAHVLVTMLGSSIDLQTNHITALRRDAKSITSNSLFAPPHGIYSTKDGYIALGERVDMQQLEQIQFSPSSISLIIAEMTTKECVSLFEQNDIECVPVLNWETLFGSELGTSLGMLQDVTRGSGYTYTTTRCPIRFDGKQLRSTLGAPMVGEHTEKIKKKLVLKPFE